MVDMAALIRALPVSALEPNKMAYIKGIIGTPEDQAWQESIVLIEPPAGRRIPYIDPLETLEKLLRGHGRPHELVRAHAKEMVVRMRKEIADECWVNFLDSFEPEPPECLSVADFLLWLREEQSPWKHEGAAPEPGIADNRELAFEHRPVAAEILDYIEQAAQVAASVPMFRGPDNWEEPWSLESLPALLSAWTMIEYVPGALWTDIDCRNDWKRGDNPFQQWRESMRPVVRELEKTLGVSVYHFTDFECEASGDVGHRLLILHWCCTFRPASAFVSYLLKISGADTVEILKEALVDPAATTRSCFTANLSASSKRYPAALNTCHRPSKGMSSCSFPLFRPAR